MTAIALFSDKGSPGVTTTTLALAVAWPRPTVIVELDPAGGDLALRATHHDGRPLLAGEPGLLTFAAAVRRDPATSLTAHAQPFAGTLVVPGLGAPGQARAMTDLWHPVSRAVQDADGIDVLADLGRLGPDAPAAGFAAAAEVLVGVARAEPGSMLRMRDRLRDLHEQLMPSQNQRMVVVLVAPDRRAAEAVGAMRRVLLDGAVSAGVAGVVSWDERGVADLYAGDRARLGRCLLLRSVSGWVGELAGTDAPATAIPARRRVLAWSR